MIKILDQEVDATKAPQFLKKVVKREEGVYSLVIGPSQHTIRVQKDGSLELDGKKYDSFAQIKIEYLS